jgi:hypothetical protein
MQLVVLAAGHGRRFGGLKQLAPVGPNGEALIDYTAHAAASCGFSGVVLVVREDILDKIRDHVRRTFPRELATEFVCQSGKPGTAQAVLATRSVVDAPFAVANADDYYSDEALTPLFGWGATTAPEGPHVLVAYRLVRTVLTAARVTRGLTEVGADQQLRRIVEHNVQLRDDGQFVAHPLAATDAHDEALTGEERVSMNLWGFHPRVFEHCEVALERSDGRREVLLPEVVGDLVANGLDSVEVVATEARCIGLTHPEDLKIVADHFVGEDELLARDANRNGPAPASWLPAGSRRQSSGDG